MTGTTAARPWRRAMRAKTRAVAGRECTVPEAGFRPVCRTCGGQHAGSARTSAAPARCRPAKAQPRRQAGRACSCHWRPWCRRLLRQRPRKRRARRGRRRQNSMPCGRAAARRCGHSGLEGARIFFIAAASIWRSRPRRRIRPPAPAGLTLGSFSQRQATMSRLRPARQAGVQGLPAFVVVDDRHLFRISRRGRDGRGDGGPSSSSVSAGRQSRCRTIQADHLHHVGGRTLSSRATMSTRRR